MIRTIFEITWLIFLQRVRKYGFLVVLGLTIIISISFVPTADSTIQTMNFSGYRGVYNSAWIGALISLLSCFCFVLFGFYFVKDSIGQDKRSGMEQLIATTPITKLKYLLHKFMSNIFLLLTIASLVLFMGVIMQVVRGEELTVRLWLFIQPFLLITVPTILFISALALVFETIPLLAGSLGNAFYLFVSMGIMALAMWRISCLDMVGVSIVMPQVIEKCQSIFPNYRGGWALINIGDLPTLGTFTWNGLQVTRTILLSRIILVLLSLALFTLAVFLFNRFDNQKETKRITGKMVSKQTTKNIVEVGEYTTPQLTLSRPNTYQNNLITLLVQEFKMDFSGKSWWWYVVACLIWLASGVLDWETAYNTVLPLAWLWPLAIWSHKRVRAHESRLLQVIATTPNGMPWQLVAEYLSAILVAVLFASLIILRGLFLSHLLNSIFILIGALFIATLASLSGAISRSAKVFEVVYLIAWYIGPFQKSGLLDFTGSAREINPPTFLILYLSLIVAMLFSLFALGGRASRFRHN